MDVPSKCTIVRAMVRSTYASEVLSGRNRAQNGGKTQNHAQRIAVARNRAASTVANAGKDFILYP